MTKIEENVKNEVVVKDTKNEVNLFSDMASKTYCSKNVVTASDKKELFNALEQCDVVLNDIVGQEIVLKDVFCEEKQVMDDASGELRTKFRTILFDVDGKTYATGSYGIYNVIKKLCSIYGLPTWEDGIKVKVAKRPMGNGKSTLTLNLL